MWRKRPIAAITAPLEDAPGPLPSRFRWLNRGILLCVILWLAVILSWVGLYQIGTRQLRSQIEDAKGQPMRSEDFRTPVPDPDNAVHYIRLAGKTFGDMTEPTPDWEELHTYPLTPAARNALRRHISKNDQTLRLIRQACSAPGVDWGPFETRLETPAPGSTNEYIHLLSRVRDLAGLLQESAMLAMADGDEAAAIEYLRNSTNLARIADEGCSILGHLLSSGWDHAALLELLTVPLPGARGSTQPAVARRASREQISALIKDLVDEPTRAVRARRAYLGERAALLATFTPQQDGFARLVDVLSARNPRAPTHSRAIRLVLAPHDRLHVARAFGEMTEAADAIIRPDWPSAKRAMTVRPAAPSPYSPPLAQYNTRMVTFGGRYIEYDFRIAAARRLAATLYAIRLYERDHGKLPPNLDALVPDYLPAVPLDPFASPPAQVSYVPDGPLPLVYSISIDGRDDIAAGYKPVWSDHNHWQRSDLIYIINYHAAKPPPATAPAP